MRITASTQVYGLIGHPARHSLSPVLQTGWFADHGLDAVYLAFECTPGSVPAVLDGLFAAGVRGLNVTLPHKEAAFAWCQQRTEAASAAAAVNTLIPGAEGVVTGDNTDGAGFLLDLDARAGGWREVSGPAVIFGSGGAARGLVAALIGAGREVRLVVRTRATGLAIARDFGLSPEAVFDWDQQRAALDSAALAINATSRGLKGAEPFEPDFAPLVPGAVVYDTVYIPQETAFLAAARAQGFTGLDGLGMLVGQGALAFERWTGQRPDLAAGLARLMAELAPC